MQKMTAVIALAIAGVFLASGLMVSTPDVSAAKLKAQAKIPAKYKGKHMPEGGWTDEKLIARGKEVYTGKVNKKVKCSKCHGTKGKPKAKGARDFRKAANMEKFSDTYWFFRIADGVPKTLMKGWLGKISEDDIWAVMAYENMFSHGGKPAVPDMSKWQAPEFK